jgi:hypothetical protein
MNHLSRLIICLCILLIIIYQIVSFAEPFDSNPLGAVKTDSSASDVAEANLNYTSLLLFLKNHPDKSVKFITDIKNKFFNESCTVKNINFDTITQLNGNIF